MSLPLGRSSRIPYRVPDPTRREGRAGRDVVPVPRLLPSSGGGGEGAFMGWEEGVVRPVALAALGQAYRRYRLADPPAEEAMAGSLRRWGQLAPVVACRRGPGLE